MMSPSEVQALKVGDRVELECPPDSPFADTAYLPGTVTNLGAHLQVEWDSGVIAIVTPHGWKRLRREGAI